jgi:multicomponent Na+:H+ antiporter subunit A
VGHRWRRVLRAWAPTLDLRLSFALLATGVGALVFAYGTRYLTVHLEHEHRQAWERWRFWPWMVLFASDNRS